MGESQAIIKSSLISIPANISKEQVAPQVAYLLVTAKVGLLDAV